VRERAAEYYRVAVRLFDEGYYSQAYLIAYAGLKILGKDGEFEGGFHASLHGLRISEEDARNIIDYLGKCVGEEPVETVEVDLLDLLLMGAVGLFLFLSFYEGVPPLAYAFSIPLAALSILGLVSRRFFK